MSHIREVEDVFFDDESPIEVVDVSGEGGLDAALEIFLMLFTAILWIIQFGLDRVRSKA